MKMDKSPIIQILTFFGFYPFWIDKITNKDSRFKLRLYPSCLCFIYMVNFVFSIIEHHVLTYFDEENNNRTNTEFELTNLYRTLIHLCPLVNCTFCTLRYQLIEKILLRINEFDMLTKNRKKPKLLKIRLQWFVILTIITVRFSTMLYEDYNWLQFIRYFIIFFLISLEQIKFIFFIKELSSRFSNINDMFIAGKKYTYIYIKE